MSRHVDVLSPVIVPDEPVNRKQRRAQQKDVKKVVEKIGRFCDMFNKEINEDLTPGMTYDEVFQKYKGVYIRLCEQMKRNDGLKFAFPNPIYFEKAYAPDTRVKAWRPFKHAINNLRRVWSTS